MEFRPGRIAVLGLAMASAFAVIALVLMRLIPPPRKDTDYLVIGTLATFGALAILFLMLITTMKKPLPESKKKD